LVLLTLIAGLAFSTGGVAVQDPVSTGTDQLLQYDDGVSHWIWPGVSYYGTWFDVTDFMPDASGFECESTEWWHYENPYNPWDTDQIVLELWSGDVSGPVTLLASDSVTALHNAPVYVNYPSALATGSDFWMVANTTVFSSVGAPHVLYDEFDNWTGTAHSFYSQNWSDWDPLVAGGYEINAFFRADGTLESTLQSDSWGAIKGLYR